MPLSQVITVFGSVTWKLANEQFKLTLSSTIILNLVKFSNISSTRVHKANQRYRASWFCRWRREGMLDGITGWQSWQSCRMFPQEQFLMSVRSLLPSLPCEWLSFWKSVCQNTSSCSVLPVNEQVAVMTQCQVSAC